MNKLITISVAILGLSLIPMQANAKHQRDHDSYEHKYERKKHHKQKKQYKHYHQSKYDRHDRHHSYRYHELPSGVYKKVGHGRGLPPGWYKHYHHGDILDQAIYRHGRVVKHRDRNGIIAIQIDNQLIHLVHDSLRILSIVSHHH